MIRPSRGTHVLLDREQLPLNAAVVVPAGEERTIFALPWLGQTLVGTTDNDYEGSLEHPPVSESDVAYLLERGQLVLRDRASAPATWPAPTRACGR